MGKSRVVGFDGNALVKAMMKEVIEKQRQLFVDYAKDKIQAIGNAIKAYHGAHNMDRTGNLLDSLCWGVCYEGKLLESGFYRPAQAHGNSYLHEWFSGDVKSLLPVYGRQLAEQYIDKYGNNGAKGWKVFFAILAPYWGYWEKGFRMTHEEFKPRGKGYSMGIRSFYRFAIMTQFYDEIKADLKPARTRFRVSVAKYEKSKLERRWNKYSRI